MFHNNREQGSNLYKINEYRNPVIVHFRRVWIAKLIIFILAIIPIVQNQFCQNISASGTNTVNVITLVEFWKMEILVIYNIISNQVLVSDTEHKYMLEPGHLPESLRRKIPEE